MNNPTKDRILKFHGFLRKLLIWSQSFIYVFCKILLLTHHKDFIIYSYHQPKWTYITVHNIGHWNLYKADTMGANTFVRLIDTSILSKDNYLSYRLSALYHVRFREIPLYSYNAIIQGF